ncbi:MAG: virulence protein RhuM/Fic/DOC family protein [Candidatus Aerophobetes bacterium]|nr:virulence protein RhuM/Fic/DOC family protein [Candidatus Aerophobetes bacterium]
MPEKNEIVIYTTPEGKETFEVNLKKDTVWLDAHQLARLFKRDRSVIVRHINNVYNTNELDKKSTCAKIAQVAQDGKKRQMLIYNLDLIISVGYRVNSKRGTQFRIWATNVLKDHLIKGYTINEKRMREDRAKLKEFQKTSRIMERLLQNKALDSTGATGLLKVILDYQKALHLLDEYDFQKLKIKKVTTREKFRISYQRARQELDRLKAHYPSTLFGLEKDQSFSGSIGAIYQSFDGKDLYPSIEEKAAHLLYFIVKNHSFIDGNKRIAASLFLWFLYENGILYNEDGSKRIADNALVALTLLIAESRAEEKDTMTKVVVNLINQNN